MFGRRGNDKLKGGAGTDVVIDDNEVEVYWRGGEKGFPNAAKTELAHQIIELVAERFDARDDEATQADSTVVEFRK